MTFKHWKNIEPILDTILDAEPEEWCALAKIACGDNVILLHEVKQLLRRVPDVQNFLQTTPAENLIYPNLDEEIVTDKVVKNEIKKIGRYRIIRIIAHGGMGSVYMAERDDGVYEQKVALKLLHSSFDSEKMCSRFRIERQILASLNHPNITRLLDGGVIQSNDERMNNRPYLVMEYLEGQPINTYCQHKNLSIHDRLNLYMKVAEAIDHAHQNLIIHCDIKPSNILVTDEGLVKLLDFGIARLFDGNYPGSNLPEPQLSTLTTRRWLTPEYAAPEQLKTERITTSVDIYQMGVLLYEILTGKRPFSNKEKNLFDLEQAILHKEPEKPSLTVGEKISRRELHGDIDAIALKALRKEPGDRYQSISVLIDDIQRYLSGQPVLARRGNLGYHSRKFASRHRWGVLTTAIILMVTSVLAGYYTHQLAIERNHAKQLAEAAQLEASTATEVSEFMVGLFAAADPYQRLEGIPTVREVLDRAVMRIEEMHIGNPLLQARLLHTLGISYSSLGLDEQAQPLIEQSLEFNRQKFDGPHPEIASNLRTLALLKYRQGIYEEALPLYEEALHIQIQELGADHPQVGNTLNQLGNLKKRTGNFQESKADFEQALKIAEAHYSPDHLETGSILNNYALLMLDMAENEIARDMFQRTITIYEKELGPNHLMLAETFGNLSQAQSRLGETGKEVESCKRFLEIAKHELDSGHSVIANALICLGNAYRNINQNSEAIPLYKRAIEIYETAHGPAHPFIAYPTANLGNSYRDAGEYRQAVNFFQRALSISEESGSAGMVANLLEDLGRLHLLIDEYDTSKSYLERAISLRSELHPTGHWRIAAVQTQLGKSLLQMGELDEAESLLINSYQLLRDSRDINDQHTQAAVRYLVELYEIRHQQDEADQFRTMMVE